MSAVLVLSACGISYDVTIHNDDTVDQTILIWDSGGMMGKSDCSAEGMGSSGATAPAGAEITYTFTTHDGDPACQITARGIPVSEFSGSSNSLSITHDNGEFDVTVPLDDGSTKALYSDSGSSYSVTFPGKVVKASGNAIIDGNTVTWNNFLDENGDLHAVGKDSPDRPWIWIAVGVVAVAIIGGGIVLTIVLTTRGKGRPAAPASAHDQSDQYGQYGQPPAPVQPGAPWPQYAQPAQTAPGAQGYAQPAQAGYVQPGAPGPEYAQPWMPQPGGQGVPGYVQPSHPQPDQQQPHNDDPRYGPHGNGQSW